MTPHGYETYMDGIPASSFNAECVSRNIEPATVVTYSDWLRQSINPLYYGKTEQYKVIKLQFRFDYDSDNDLLQYAANLVKAFEKCQLKFSNMDYYFDCSISGSSFVDMDGGKKELAITLNSSYAYLPPVTANLVGKTGAINFNGNAVTPAIVTLTPSQDIGRLALSGLTKKPITVNNLHAGAPIVIDGENCLVTEADLDTVITDAQGNGKWMFRKYSEAGMFSPDTYNANFTPTKDLILPNATYIQELIDDTADLYEDYANNYLGWLRTGLYSSSAKSITFQFLHDDGASVYFNGALIYSKDCVEQNSSAHPGYPSITLNLNAGWNTLEFLWLNHLSLGGIYSISPTISSLVEKLNCYYAKLNDVGTVNKFPDTDMWEFPSLQPGQNNISTDSDVCSVSVQYKPKWI